MDTPPYGTGTPQRELGRALKDNLLENTALHKPATLEGRIDGYTKIADRVSSLASTNPYGALHLIEQLEAHERTPALYGIVAQGIAGMLSHEFVRDPEEFARYQSTPVYRLAQQTLAYCERQMGEIGAPMGVAQSDKPYAP